jgi:RES domain-containing protein
MELFRIAKEKYAFDLTPSGSANRWNLTDQQVIYAASSRSLATLELTVHRTGIITKLPYRVMVLSVPDQDHFVHQIKIGTLPENWRTIAAYSKLQQLGSQWYRDKSSLLLKIPSAVIPMEYNYILNTLHPDFEMVKLVRTEPYFWDDRLT